MKILKYIVFLSILSGIFLVIYRQSDKKGFRRWWISFKMAAFIAATLASLITPSTEVIETYVPNNSPSTETVLSNQEFYSLEENDRQVILAKAELFQPEYQGQVIYQLLAVDLAAMFQVLIHIV